MGEASGRENGDSLFLLIRDFADQLAYLIAAARRGNRVHPGVHVDGQDRNFWLRQKEVKRHDLRMLQLNMLAVGKIDALFDPGL